MEAFTDNDVSNFLKALIELGGLRVVDDTPDKFIRFTSDNLNIQLKDGDETKNLAIYGTKDPQALIINPFAEGDSQSQRSDWFYTSTTQILAGYLIKIMHTLLNVGVNSKKKAKKNEEDNVDMTAIKLVSKYAADIDEKMVKEFTTISNNLSEFFTIYYNKTRKETEVKCPLFIEARRKGYPSIRKSTWNVLIGLMGEVLGTEDMTRFTYRSNLMGCPAFEGFCTVLCDIYDRIQPALSIIGVRVDTIQIRGHLKYIDQYYAKAKWCTSCVSPVVKANPGAGVPWGVPNVSINGSVPAFNMPMGFPAPPQAPNVSLPNIAPIGMQPVMGQMPMGTPMSPMQPIGTLPVQLPPYQSESTGSNRNNPLARA